MILAVLNKKRLLFGLILMSCFTSFNTLSCSNDDDEPQETIQDLRFGAIYISCESAPWKFNFEGVIDCEQEELAQLELNPNHACAMQDIQMSNGDITVSFSENAASGRLHVTVNSNVILQDEDGNITNEIYVNDEDTWFLTKNEIRLKLNIVNVYVGGCFHELIRWEEVSN